MHANNTNTLTGNVLVVLEAGSNCKKTNQTCQHLWTVHLGDNQREVDQELFMFLPGQWSSGGRGPSQTAVWWARGWGRPSPRTSRWRRATVTAGTLEGKTMGQWERMKWEERGSPVSPAVGASCWKSSSACCNLVLCWKLGSCRRPETLQCLELWPAVCQLESAVVVVVVVTVVCFFCARKKKKKNVCLHIYNL